LNSQFGTPEAHPRHRSSRRAQTANPGASPRGSSGARSPGTSPTGRSARSPA
jgi:hypothetical protein